MKSIGISEVGGGDTDLGALVCAEIRDALIKAGYDAKYLPVSEEFDCDISLNLSMAGNKDDLSVEIMHYDSLTACSKSKTRLSSVQAWTKSVILYFVSESII